MKARLAKKKYLDEIYLDIEAHAFVRLVYGVKNDTSHTNVTKLMRQYRSDLKGTRNPYFKATRLSTIRDQAIDLARRI